MEKMVLWVLLRDVPIGMGQNKPLVEPTFRPQWHHWSYTKWYKKWWCINRFDPILWPIYHGNYITTNVNTCKRTLKKLEIQVRTSSLEVPGLKRPISVLPSYAIYACPPISGVESKEDLRLFFCAYFYNERKYYCASRFEVCFLWSDKAIYRTTKNLEWFSSTSKTFLKLANLRFDRSRWIIDLELPSHIPRAQDYDEKTYWKSFWIITLESKISNPKSQKILNPMIMMSHMYLLGLITVFEWIVEPYGTRHYSGRSLIRGLETILLSRGHRMLKS